MHVLRTALARRASDHLPLACELRRAERNECPQAFGSRPSSAVRTSFGVMPRRQSVWPSGQLRSKHGLQDRRRQRIAALSVSGGV